MTIKNKGFKRVFFDLETSPNVVFSWNVGYKLNIGHENILTERAIICVCYKYEGESKVHTLTWNKGDDKKLVQDLAKVINGCDEAIAHNGDQYDIKWLRTRCLYHGVSMIPDVNSIDTLKLCRKSFRLNSNKLDYVSKFLGLSGKMETGGFGLWKDIILKNSKPAMKKMVSYCQKDVILLEKVFQKLNSFVLSKSHKGVHAGKEPHNCPECGGDHTISNGVRVMANGLKKRRLQCIDCGKYFQISNSVYEAIKPLVEKK